MHNIPSSLLVSWEYFKMKGEEEVEEMAKVFLPAFRAGVCCNALGFLLWVWNALEQPRSSGKHRICVWETHSHGSDLTQLWFGSQAELAQTDLSAELVAHTFPLPAVAQTVWKHSLFGFSGCSVAFSCRTPTPSVHAEEMIADSSGPAAEAAEMWTSS